jgi:hypothetical protein
MPLSAEVLAEEPEQSLHRLQRQRTNRIIMTIVALAAVLTIGGIFTALSYQDGPEATRARESPANR